MAWSSGPGSRPCWRRGSQRQLKRTDLPAGVRAQLEDAQTTLWAAIARDKAVANSELWSWAYADGRYKIVPFGAGQGDADESNAAQLWSTVFLALGRRRAEPDRTKP